MLKQTKKKSGLKWFILPQSMKIAIRKAKVHIVIVLVYQGRKCMCHIPKALRHRCPRNIRLLVDEKKAN